MPPLRGVLEARGFRSVAVSVPAGTAGGIGHGRGVGAAIRGLHRRGGGKQLAGGELRHQAALRLAELGALLLHLAVGQRVEHCFGSELVQLGAGGCLLIGTARLGGVLLMAQGATRGEEHFVFG